MKILVPYDFTPVTRTALDHALSLHRVLGGNIELLHIVSKESLIKAAEMELNSLIAGLSADEKQRVSATVREGDIFQDITQEAVQGGAQLLVMGTHGAKGLQKIMGSKAIKVITSGNTPFVVTQSKGPVGNIDKIVMPVELTKESVQIVSFAAQLAERFAAEVHILYQPVADEWLIKKVQGNIAYAGSVLGKRKLKYVVAELNSKKPFAKETIAYAQKVEAGLMAIAHFSESILPQFDTFSQEIITNKAQIPVLIVNAEPVGKAKGQYSFLTI